MGRLRSLTEQRVIDRLRKCSSNEEIERVERCGSGCSKVGEMRAIEIERLTVVQDCLEALCKHLSFFFFFFLACYDE